MTDHDKQATILSTEDLDMDLDMITLTDVLNHLADGQTMRAARTQLRDVIAGVVATNKKGTVTIVLTAEFIEGTGLMGITGQVTSKVPTLPGGAAYTVDRTGALLGQQLTYGE